MKFQLNRKNRRKEEENLSRRNQEESKDFNENGNQLTISSLSSDRTHFKTNEIPYLECQFAVFTPSLSQCNIGELIKQPEGVDQNEWIAIHSLYYICFFFLNPISFSLKLFLFLIILIYYMVQYLIYVQQQNVL
jgi:hypothetical protein